MNAPVYTVPKEQASSLLELALLLPFAKSIVGEPGAQGIRFVFFKILAIESYACFREPIFARWRGWRIVLWKTTTSTLAPGWHKWPGIPIGRTNAVSFVHEDFFQDWNANARRLVLHQQKNGITARVVTLKEFAKKYHASGYLDPFLRHGFVRIIKDHIRIHPQDVSILFFSTKKEEFLGATVFVDYPDIQHSHYLISFVTEIGRKEGAGYAFIYWWYQHMLVKGLQWADFGIVWQPGDPSSWRGYSEFKKRFHPQFYTHTSYWKRA